MPTVEFDPSQPYEAVEDSSASVSFDPNQPFDILDESEKLPPVEPGPVDSGQGILSDTANRIGRGFSEGTGLMMKGLARLGTMFPNVGDPSGFTPPQEPVKQTTAQAQEFLASKDPTFAMGQAFQEAGADYPTNPAMDDTLRAKVAAGIGSTLPSMALGLTFGPPALMAAYGAQAGEQGAEEAIAAGKVDQADKVFLLNAGIGISTEMLFGGVSKRVIKAVSDARKAGVKPEQWGTTVKERAVQAAAKTLKGALGEGAQEGVEQAGNNAVAKWLYDPERELMQGVTESALVGAISGGAISAPFYAAAAASAPMGPVALATKTDQGTYASGQPMEPMDLKADPNAPNVQASPEAQAFFGKLDEANAQTAPGITPEQAASDLNTVVDPGEFDVAPGLLDRLRALEPTEENVAPMYKRASQEAPVVIGEQPAEPKAVITPDEAVNTRASILADAKKVLEMSTATLPEKVNAHIVIEKLSRLEVPEPKKLKEDVESGKLGWNRESDTIIQWFDRADEALKTNLKDVQIDPFLINTIGKPATRAVLKIVRETYIAGRSIPKAIEAGIQWLKDNKHSFDEGKVREWFLTNVVPQPGGERDINQRDRITKIDEDKAVDETVKNKIWNQLYQVGNSAETAKAAKELIASYRQREPQGIGYLKTAELDIKSNASAMPGDLVAKAYLEIQDRYNEVMRMARATGDQQAMEFISDQEARMISEDFGSASTWAAKFLQALNTFSKTSPEGAIKHAERIIEKGNKKAQESAVRRGIKFVKRKLTVAEKERITKLAEAIAKIPEDRVIDRQDATIDLMDEFAAIEGLAWYERPIAFWYANILSNPLSHVRNTIGSLTNLAANTVSSTILTPIDGINSVVAAIESLPRGFREATEIIATGKQTGRRVSTNINPRGYLERTKFKGLKAPLNAWKYVGRLLAAEDAVAFYMADAQRQELLTRAVAKKEGLSGAALRRRVSELMNRLDGTRAAAEAKAKAEGKTGRALERRVDEIIDQGRDQAVVESATEFALRTTFNNNPYGFLGLLAHHINQINDKAVFTRAVMPFVNIVSNVTNEALNYGPVGATRVILAWRGGTLYGKPATKLDIQELTVKAAVGIASLASLMGLAARFLEDDDAPFAIYGNGPLGDSQRKTWLEAGHMPYSMKFGKKHVSYMQTPLALVLATIGNYHDALRYRDLGKQEAIDQLAYGIHGSFGAIMNQSFLSSLSDFMEGMKRNGSDGGAEKIAAMSARAVGSMAIPSALGFIDGYVNPGVADRKGIEGAVLSTIPFVRALNKPALNGLGEPVTRKPHQGIAKDLNDDPVWTELARVNAGIFPREATFRGTPLSDQQLYELVRLSGPVIRKRIEGQMPLLQRLPAEESRRRINKIAQETRERFKAQAAK